MSYNHAPEMVNTTSNNIITKKNDRQYEDMYQAGLKLPQRQRVRISQYYYQRVHLRNLGLRLASTCDYHILRQVFGEVTDIVIEQAEELERQSS